MTGQYQEAIDGIHAAGIGVVGLVFACIANITNSTWMRPLRHLPTR